jgi:protein gp37
MAENTSISWTDHTFNPWLGCTKISPACDNCYAENLMDKRMHVVTWGAGQARKRTSKSNWQLPRKWNRRAALMEGAWQRGIELHDYDEAACIANGFIEPNRPRVFCASLADVFDNAAPAEWRVDLLDLIAETPHLDWLLLTKRIGNAHQMLTQATAHDHRFLDSNDHYCPPQNLWIGATICNQAEADRDIPKLLATPAAKRFLSIEPMLGAVDLSKWLELARWDSLGRAKQTQGLDLVICGGESGKNARPMHPDWVRSLRDQCQAAGVPFHLKQWGEWLPARNNGA